MDVPSKGSLVLFSELAILHLLVCHWFHHSGFDHRSFESHFVPFASTHRRPTGMGDQGL